MRPFAPGCNGFKFSYDAFSSRDIADSIAQTMGGADEEIMNEIRADYGLDKPLFINLEVIF